MYYLYLQLVQTDSRRAEGDGSIKPVCQAQASDCSDRSVSRDPCPPATEFTSVLLTEPGPRENRTAVRQAL